MMPTASVTAIPTSLTVFLAMSLTLAPPATPIVHAQTLREAGKAATTAQVQSPACRAKAEELLKECAAEEEEDARTPGRSGLGWTGIGLASAGAGVLAQGLTVSRWRSCGPNYRSHCESLERVYRTGGGVMLATGLTFLVIDETRRARDRRDDGPSPQPSPRHRGEGEKSSDSPLGRGDGVRRTLRPSRQMAIAFGPRAVQLRMLW